MWHEIRAMDDRVAELDRDIAAIAQSDANAVRLQQLRGVGPIIATALVAAVGDARQFANGRQLSASLGLTPRQHSSGGKERLLGISKRGDAYLRSLLVHGARAMLRTARGKDDRLGRWVCRLAERAHPTWPAWPWPTRPHAWPGPCCATAPTTNRTWRPPPEKETSAHCEQPEDGKPVGPASAHP